MVFTLIAVIRPVFFIPNGEEIFLISGGNRVTSILRRLIDNDFLVTFGKEILVRLIIYKLFCLGIGLTMAKRRVNSYLQYNTLIPYVAIMDVCSVHRIE